VPLSACVAEATSSEASARYPNPCASVRVAGEVAQPDGAVIARVASHDQTSDSCCAIVALESWILARDRMAHSVRSTATIVARKKLPKATIEKAHRIARGLKRSGARVRNPWAVGMAQAKRGARKRRRGR
jgi:hypothetical protein